MRTKLGQFLERSVYLVSLGAATSDEVARQKEGVFKALANAFDDQTINRVSNLVDWRSPTPLTVRHVQMLGHAAAQEQRRASAIPSSSVAGFAYFDDGNRVGKPVFLGSGMFNQVRRGSWLQHSHEQEMAFKEHSLGPLHSWAIHGIDARAGNTNVLGRNIASYETASALGLSELLPATYPAQLDGKQGMVMGMAPGVALCSQNGSLSFRLPGDHVATAQKREAFAVALRSQGMVVKHYQDDRVQLGLLREPHRDVMLMPVDQSGICEDGRLNLQLNRLAWLDLVCGQADRNPTNLIVNFDAQGKLSTLTGIDNDFSFGCGVGVDEIRNPVAGQWGRVADNYYVGMPGHIDEVTAEKITELANDDARRSQFCDMLRVNGLAASEVEQALARLDSASKKIGLWSTTAEQRPDVTGRRWEIVARFMEKGLMSLRVARSAIDSAPPGGSPGMQGDASLLSRMCDVLAIHEMAAPAMDPADEASMERRAAILLETVPELEKLLQEMQDSPVSLEHRFWEEGVVAMKELVGGFSTMAFMLELIHGASGDVPGERVRKPFKHILSADPAAWAECNDDGYSKRLRNSLAYGFREGEVALIDPRKLMPALYESLGLTTPDR